jgi:hypothetical protein
LVASGPDKAMACRYCQTTRVWRAWRKAYVFVWALDCQSREEGARNIDFILILRFEISGVGEPLDSWVVRIWPEREERLTWSRPLRVGVRRIRHRSLPLGEWRAATSGADPRALEFVTSYDQKCRPTP